MERKLEFRASILILLPADYREERLFKFFVSRQDLLEVFFTVGFRYFILSNHPTVLSDTSGIVQAYSVRTL